MQRLLLICLLMAPLAAQASEVKIDVRAVVLLDVLLPRYVPPPSRHHLMAPPEGARDACVFVAGVRHCPLPPLRAESR